ncbi:oxidoreductase [Aspergillus avenaceus]|uniref:Oxidoreductase n=1 Tax=Aspergillus avenaceus TaxID=36643 RepID=A0A5N6TGK7_ASPAV|nr:oxidoreductase [Aspergillus avenaceus]
MTLSYLRRSLYNRFHSVTLGRRRLSSIPIIDFGGFYSNAKDRTLLIDQVRQACLQYGFFQITNHRVPSVLQKAIFTQAQDVFKLPLEVKDKYNNRDPKNYNRGYERPRSNNYENQGPGDSKEGFYFSEKLPPDHPAVLAGTLSAQNQYPAEIRDATVFRRVVDTYYEYMVSLSRDLMCVLAQTLELSPRWFDEFGRSPTATLGLLHYAAQTPDASKLERGIGAHTDFGTITILLQDNNGGLQVWDREGRQWVDVTPVPGALVVNLGNLMMRWTNDRYLSNLHRVINTSGNERYSVPFFFGGNPDYVVECLPSEETEGKYPPVSVREWMQGQYSDSLVGKSKGYKDLFPGIEQALK